MSANPIQEAAQQWEAKAIDQCRNDPDVIAAGLCPECMCGSPCLCDAKNTIRAMRTYYEENRRIESCNSWFCKKISRAEPRLIGSWGMDMDGLMTELRKIAIRDYEAEIARLERKLMLAGLT